MGVEHLLWGGRVWVRVRGSWWFDSPLQEVSLLTLGGRLLLLVSASVPLELLVRGSGGGIDFDGLRPVVREPADVYNNSNNANESVQSGTYSLWV